MSQLPTYSTFSDVRMFSRDDYAQHATTIHAAHFFVIESPSFDAVFAIKHQGFVTSVFAVWNLERTKHLHQYGYIFPPHVDHTRFRHMVMAYVLATMVSEKLGIAKSDAATLRFAALTHDAAIPACGDSIKFLSPTELDEDNIYEAWLLEPEHAYDNLAKLEVDHELLLTVIQNKGPLGSLLDWVDKNSYIGIDVDFIEAYEDVSNLLLHPPISNADIREAVALWDTIVLVGDRVCSNDLHALTKFMKLRAHMFTNFYLNPDLRMRFHFHSRVTFAMLHATNELSLGELLVNTDAYMRGVVDIVYGYEHGTLPLPIQSSTHTSVVRFADEELARTHLRHVLADPHTLGFFYHIPHEATSIARPLTSMPFTSGNSVTPVATLDAALSHRLTLMSQGFNDFVVFTVSNLECYEPTMLGLMRKFCLTTYG